jgi:hypothetical protein
MYLSKDVKIREYFSKPEGVREQKGLENPALGYSLGNQDSKDLNF